MKILDKNFKDISNVSLILGFFDGVHAGHREVIKNTPNNEKVLVTFSKSPAEFFGREFRYIYSRENNYNLIEKLGIDYIYEQDFSEIVSNSADEYLQFLIKKFSPISITTGFNHTFGANRLGNPDFIKNYTKNFEYFCTPATKINGETVSSTRIKELLSLGNIKKANEFLIDNFTIESSVIKGAQLGRNLGFPTANLKYPKNIIKIPYGVYKVKVFDKPAVMNWGIKPTIGSDEIIEVHIPNFTEDLYNKELQIEIISKIRDEKKFSNLDDLKEQIKKDVEECLK